MKALRLLVVLSFFICSHLAHASYSVDPKIRSQQGIASWYGDNLKNRPTASGEPFDPKKLTAAHPSLPFGTYVKVTNMRNQRTVIVRINDRGPYSGKRIIDLSRAAAEKIGLRRAGIGPVKIQILK
ncbi:septal ring lytic transglycosylase RlpA family protein [Pseudomonas sp. F1_0610]|uniref:septal ring lytic transglycosylase RlpA family protein n=1 Tax=Pseudomonas sp. F1_0610 TaxID=3114284 RepID=UPI0039C301AA